MWSERECRHSKCIARVHSAFTLTWHLVPAVFLALTYKSAMQTPEPCCRPAPTPQLDFAGASEQWRITDSARLAFVHLVLRHTFTTRVMGMFVNASMLLFRNCVVEGTICNFSAMNTTWPPELSMQAPPDVAQVQVSPTSAGCAPTCLPAR